MAVRSRAGSWRHAILAYGICAEIRPSISSDLCQRRRGEGREQGWKRRADTKSNNPQWTGTERPKRKVISCGGSIHLVYDNRTQTDQRPIEFARKSEGLTLV